MRAAHQGHPCTRALHVRPSTSPGELALPRFAAATNEPGRKDRTVRTSDTKTPDSGACAQSPRTAAAPATLRHAAPRPRPRSLLPRPALRPFFCASLVLRIAAGTACPCGGWEVLLHALRGGALSSCLCLRADVPRRCYSEEPEAWERNAAHCLLTCGRRPRHQPGRSRGRRSKRARASASGMRRQARRAGPARIVVSV